MRGRAIYSSFQKLAWTLNFDALLRRVRRGTLILMYHSIPTRSTTLYEVGKSCFEEHLRYLKANFKILKISSILNRKRKKESGLVCAVTFDDGYEDNYVNAYPLLLKYNVPAMIFLCTGWMLRGQSDTGRKMLSWKQAHEMKESGNLEFGTHTHNHKDLTCLPCQSIINEIEKSRRLIEERLGVNAKCLSIPHGGIDGRVQNIIRESGAITGLFTSEGKINAPDADAMLGRICIYKSSEAMSSFVFKVYGLTDTLSIFKHRTLRL